MGRDMAIVLAGRLIAKPTTFKRIDAGNEVTVRTLAGKIYTDFRDRNRSWEVGWKNILYENDLETLRTIWAEQYSTGIYPVLQFVAEGVYGPVKMGISDQKIKLNGVLVENFIVTMTEQNPVS